MKRDVLQPYRLDCPLIPAERDFIDLLYTQEERREWLAGAGLTIVEHGEESLLRWDKTGDVEPVILALEPMAESLFQEHTWLSRQRAGAARRVALRLAIQVWGVRDERTLERLQSLADCLYELDVRKEALLLFEKAKSQRERILGKSRPDTLASYRGWVRCRERLGEKPELLLPEYEWILKTRRKKLGSLDRYTLDSLCDYASCIRGLGDYEKSLAIFKQLYKTRSKVLGKQNRYTLQSLYDLIYRLFYMGKKQKTLARLKKLFEIRQQVLSDRHPDTLSSLNGLAFCYRNMGYTTEALLLYEHNLSLRREVLGPDHRDTRVSLNNYAFILLDVGATEKALKEFKYNLKIRIKILGKQHPATLLSMSNLAFCYRQSGKLSKALLWYKKAYVERKKLRGTDNPTTLISYAGLGRCYQALGKLEKGLSIFEEVLKLRQAKLHENHVRILDSLNDLAECYHALDRTKEALSIHTNILAKRTEIIGYKHPDTIESLFNLAVCLEDLNHPDAAPRFLELATRLADRPLFSAAWPQRVEQVAHRIARWSLDPPGGVVIDWITYLNALSRTFVELMDLQPSVQIEVLRPYFLRFHTLFLKLCLRMNRKDLLPELLTRIQGRQLAALMLEELERSATNDWDSLSLLQRELLELRLALRQMALGLGGSKEQGQSQGDGEGVRGGRLTASGFSSTVAQGLAEYDVLYQQYHALLGRLRQENPNFAMAAPALDVDLPTLQAGLAAEDALALLLHVRAADDANERVFVLLITARDHQLVPLPAAFLPLPSHAWRQQEAISDRAGLRYTRTAGADAALADAAPGAGPASAAAWAAAMDRSFWQPLAPALRGLRTVHLVSHGDFHVLPYAAGGPPARTVYTYPGLLFYHHRRRPHAAEAAPPHPSPAAPLGLHGYSAADHPDHPTIPLVDAETRLIAALWPEAVRTPLTLPPADPVTFLHCAGHGQHPTADPLGAGLVLGPDAAARLDCRALFRSALRPRVVFLSACVVGRTREDRDGEPLGLVSTFLLSGATYVVAPLQPVSDCLMPLLAGLFHQAWRAGLAPPQALLEAKRRLAEGDWYPDTADRVRAAYAATLAAYLPALLAEPDRKRQRQGLSALRRWPLPPAYAQAGEAGLRAQLASERGRQGFIADFLDHLEHHRRALPVAELLPWVVGFGGPAS